MSRPISDWKDDCLECVSLCNDDGIVVDLECAKKNLHCKWKPGMDRSNFDGNGICPEYSESKKCNPDGTPIIEEG